MPEPLHDGRERRDVNASAIGWFGVGLLCVLVLVFAGIRFFMSGLARVDGEIPSPPQSWSAENPAASPGLQTAPAADLAAVQSEARAKLSAYGWVDRPAGIIRIPIDRAMELIAERGLPARKAGTGGNP